MKDAEAIMDVLYAAVAEDNDLASNILDRVEGMGQPQLAEFCDTFVADLHRLEAMFAAATQQH